MVGLLYVVTLISSAIGGLVLLGGVVGARSAPQEAAGAAMAIALAVIPYVFTRCVQLANDYKERRESTRKLIDLLEENTSIARSAQDRK